MNYFKDMANNNNMIGKKKRYRLMKGRGGWLKGQFFRCADFKGVEILGGSLYFLDGICDKKVLDEVVIPAIYEAGARAKMVGKDSAFGVAEQLEAHACHCSQRVLSDRQEILQAVLGGHAVFLCANSCFAFDLKSLPLRGIGEPTDENVLKGAKDCFVESLQSNCATLRAKVKNAELKIRHIVCGEQTNTTIAMVYFANIANKRLVARVLRCLQGINEDGALSPAVIEEQLAGRKFSLFPQAEYTERPDKLCANLLEGRIGIIIDGMPVVFIVPATLAMFMQAPEDYAFSYAIATFVRIVRYISLFIAMLAPALYIAVTAFHPEMLPSTLALSIIKSRKDVPFPIFAEIFLMLFAFELLIEAGLRLPKTIGQAMSIVGAIVVGQAAVSAKLMSPAIIVVISLSGIAGFTIPKQELANAIRLLRFLFACLAALAGLVFVAFGLCALLYYLSGLNSFGVPYLSPFVSQKNSNDTLVRAPLSMLNKRPSALAVQNIRRKK